MAGNLVLGVFFGLLALLFLVESTKLPYHAAHGAGPGFLPFWVSIGMMIGSAGLALAGAWGATRVQLKGLRPAPSVTVAVLALLGAVLTLRLLGFLTTIWLLLSVLFRTLAHLPLARSGILAALLVAAIWLVFGYGLGLFFSPGPLGF